MLTAGPGPLVQAWRLGVATSVPVHLVTALALANLFVLAQAGRFRGDWTSTVPAAQTSVFVIGILACAVAAWESDRDRRSGLAAVTRALPRPRVTSDLPGWVGVFAVSVVAYLSASITAMTATAVSQPSGRPDLRLLAVGVPVLAAMVGLGWLLGSLVPAALAAPLAAALAFCWLGLVEPLTYGTWAAALNGLHSSAGSSSEVARGLLLTGQVVFFLGAAAVFLLAAASREPAVGVPRRIVATAITLPCLGIALLVVNGPERITLAPAASTCTQVRAVEVCVRPEHAGRLPLLEQALLDQTRAADASPGPPIRLLEYNSLRPAGSPPVPGEVEFLRVPRDAETAHALVDSLLAAARTSTSTGDDGAP